MDLNTLKQTLAGLNELNFIKENGSMVPKHFHITEVGQITRKFIDCGGTIREEHKINLQLWETSLDQDHRLEPSKFASILAIAEKHLGIQNHEIDVEYQAETIGKYQLDFDGDNFVLLNTNTACLASDQCGIKAPKVRLNLQEIGTATAACCGPGSTCC